jgi:hypothetical protein
VVATPLWEQLDKDLMAMGTSSAPGEAMDNFSGSILLGRFRGDERKDFGRTHSIELRPIRGIPRHLTP